MYYNKIYRIFYLLKGTIRARASGNLFRRSGSLSELPTMECCSMRVIYDSMLEKTPILLGHDGT